MIHIGKSKIGRLVAKKGKIYPQIRLPPQLSDTIGEVTDVFETEYHGKRAFLLVTQSMQNNDEVLQPNDKVVKRIERDKCGRRFCALESKISYLKSLLFLNNGDQPHQDKKEARLNGLGRIRTGDLRHVNAPFRNWSPC